MHKVRNFPQFTHFACLPFVKPSQRQTIQTIQQRIRQALLTKYTENQFSQSNYNLAHITISMLILHRQQARQHLQKILDKLSIDIKKNLAKTILTFNKIGYFTRFNNKTKKNEVTLIYLQIQKDEQYRKIEWLQDLFIRQMIKSQIIVSSQLKEMRIRYDHNQNKYKNQQNHLTLFRVKNIEKNQEFLNIFSGIEHFQQKIVFQCNCFDISTRSNYDQNNFYKPFARITLKQEIYKQIQSVQNQQKQNNVV